MLRGRPPRKRHLETSFENNGYSIAYSPSACQPVLDAVAVKADSASAIPVLLHEMLRLGIDEAGQLVQKVCQDFQSRLPIHA